MNATVMAYLFDGSLASSREGKCDDRWKEKKMSNIPRERARRKATPSSDRCPTLESSHKPELRKCNIIDGPE